MVYLSGYKCGDKAAGMAWGGIIMLGAIIGDIVGSRFEFNNHRSKDFELFAEGCFTTDDSIMTLAVAKAIMETAKTPSTPGYDHNHDFHALLSNLTVKYMQKIGRKYPNCGFGGMFYKWVFSNNPEPYHSRITASATERQCG